VITEFERMAQLAPAWDWARCAIIARNWRSLDPVRSYCELQGIPVQQADEDSRSLWSLREAVSEYALDVGDGELLLDHFLDWLAERSQESRRRQIDLGFAARYPPGHAIDRSRAVLAVGSRIALCETSADAWRLCDVQGVDVGALSQHFEPEIDMHCIEARIAAIHVRRPRDVAEPCKSRINEQVQSFKPLVVNCGARHPADVRG